MKKFYCLFNEGSKINQIICAILINIPVFGYGVCIGWMSPTALLLQSENSPRGTPLSDFEISWMASAPYLVCIVADYLMAVLSDKIGRKITLFFLSTMTFATWAIKLSSLEVWALILARSLIGITMAGAYVTCPLYTKEISQDSIRGLLGSLVVLFHTSGNLFAYIIGDLLSYRTVLWICLMIPTFHLILFLMMPESPSYLVKRGKTEEAARVLAWLRCRKEDDATVQTELNQIKKEQLNDQESSKFAIKAIWSNKILFRAFKIAIVVALAREACGAIPVMNFAGEIFENASKESTIILTPNQQAMMLGAVQMTGAALASMSVELVGRKLLFVLTALVSGLSMSTLASWFLAREYGMSGVAWLPIATLCLCIFCDAYGLQPISVIITGEIFSFKYRGTVMAITMSSSSFFAFMQALFFKAVSNSLGVYTAFYFFAGICIVATIYALLVVPETKNKSLEEIYALLKTKKERMSEAMEMERRKVDDVNEHKESGHC